MKRDVIIPESMTHGHFRNYEYTKSWEKGYGQRDVSVRARVCVCVPSSNQQDWFPEWCQRKQYLPESSGSHSGLITLSAGFCSTSSFSVLHKTTRYKPVECHSSHHLFHSLIATQESSRQVIWSKARCKVSISNLLVLIDDSILRTFPF